MATNEILPFSSTDTGTNLLSQAEYDADAQRPIGNQAGIARSKLVNKVLKQTSLISAAVAQYIADNQIEDVTDGDAVLDIAGYLESAIQSQIDDSLPEIIDASETVKGVLKLSTVALAQAFVDDLTAITPKKLADSMKGSNQSLGVSGYQIFPGGLILQWDGFADVGLNTYPITFPNSVLTIVATDNDDNVNAVAVLNVSNSQYNILSADSGTVRMFAVGF
jgi:hypothetical protein